MELKLHDVLDYDTHEVFVGELIQTHVDENVLTEGKIDLSKVNPIFFDLSSLEYWSLGPSVGKCWSVGKSLKA
jgi:flavin reductase (DIM6/NTAB) family NADH-FMN oxidoreductase RutF